MAGANSIGQTMQTAPPEIVGGQPGWSYYDQARAYFRELKQMVEGTAVSLASLVVTGALTAASAAISALSAASATIGALTCTTLHATGAATLDTTLGVTGTSTLGAVNAGALACSTLHATGAATLDSTLGVTGTSTLGVVNAGATACSTLHATGVATLDTNATVGGTLGITGTTTAAAVNGTALSGSTSVTTSEGDIRHGDVTLQLSFSAFVSANPATDYTYSTADGPAYLSFAASTKYAYADVCLKIGDRIKTIVANLRDATLGTMTMKAFKVNASGTATQIGTTQTSAGGGAADVTLTISGLTETVASNLGYYIQVRGSNSQTLARIYNASVTFDRP